MSMSETFSLLYFNKTLLHKSSEQSSLVSGPGLNSPPPEAKNPSVFHGSATTFHEDGGGSNFRTGIEWLLPGAIDKKRLRVINHPFKVKCEKQRAS